LVPTRWLVWEESSLNLGWIPSALTEAFHCFPQSLPVSAIIIQYAPKYTILK
jgi:hypothetical protein